MRINFEELVGYASAAWRGYLSADEMDEAVDLLGTEVEAMETDKSYVSDVICSLVDNLYEDMLNGCAVSDWYEPLNDLIMRNTYNK